MNSCSKPVVVEINIGDQLTSISCGHIVVELIKFIAYQRLQIPYNYQWLKQIVNKRKLFDDQGRKDTFQSERHFHTASMALENLDYIVKSLLQEINGPSIPEEVCITLGGTPVTSKEVYRILLPTICHKQQCHSPQIATDQKIQRNVFQTLVTSNTLSQMFYNQLPPTNMHVFMRKTLVNNQNMILNEDNFVHAGGFRIPRNSRIVVIDFRSHSQEHVSCCNDFKIFSDTISNNLVKMKIGNSTDREFDEVREIESTDTVKWYQSTYIMKGFKDCTVNGISVTNSWCES